ncbi:MAG: hypothetical protein PHC89_01230 [Candidatus Pacebacteria bacterium]|nr:hypothetical protein [Candidatus Paceibacterota bacterium]
MFAKFQKYLPSKKTQYLIGALLLVGVLLLVSLFIFKKIKGKGNNLLSISLIEDSKQASTLVKDSDDDGAYDWEEIAAGLDPENPYSNGNGVLDGIYLKEIQRRERARFVVEGGESLSEMEKFLRSGLSAVVAFEEAGGVFNEKNQEQFDKNIEQYVSTLPLGGKIYLKSDIKRTNDTYQKIKSYESLMKKALSSYPINLSDFELLVAAAKDQTLYTGKLYVTSEKYKKYLNELLSAEVPQSVTETHLRLLNNISSLSSSFDNLLLKEPDDIIIVSSIIQMESLFDDTISTLQKLNIFFDVVATSSPDDMSQTQYEEEPEEGGEVPSESGPRGI